MKWRDLLTKRMDETYFAAERLFDMVDETKLDWKPETGQNWMTTGQLILHISWACGGCIKGFVTGDWSPPKEAEMLGGSEEMLASAEQLPTASSLARAKEMLAEDKKLAYQLLAQCSDDDLETKGSPAPWDPREQPLGWRMLEMIDHLNQHKGQLFYYLKLQGNLVNTWHLWGVVEPK